MKRVWLLLLILLLAGCVSPPPRKGPNFSVVWRPSPNFEERRPVYVILHHTGSTSADRGLFVLTDPAHKVSAHYLVGRDGTIYQLVDERYRAWHAGVSRWATNKDLNSSSIGIEIDNSGSQPFPDVQISALLKLLKDIQQRYHIPAENFLGHADITPGRKVDPSRYFPWERLANKGFGRWCYRNPLPNLPLLFDPSLALQLLGYDINRMNAAVQAFKLHYFPENANTPELSEFEQQVLYCLVEDKKPVTLLNEESAD
ncbi:MAG: N-acetylmuramoyl-L-alanine amidase [Pseudomonadota bacterium]